MEKNEIDDTIDRFKDFERFGSRLGLERMSKLMELLENPQEELKFIHVAGTNGKGSVCKYLYEALQANGYKIGLFTSPFLEVFNERIEFNHSFISDEDLKLCTDRVLIKVDEMLAQGYDSPTEFEVITAVAFVYFHMKKADFVVLEVGLGGSGDSTNIIKKPEICVITSISFDHMDRLGNTLGEIAGEKAGIIKRGIPVVANVEQREAAKVIAKAAYENAAVLHDVTKIKYAITEKTIAGYKLDTTIYGTSYAEVEIGMIGKHQVQNVITALTALELLRKSEAIKVERSRLYAGLKNARQIGRFEILNLPLRNSFEPENRPLYIIDGAHNEAGADALAETVTELLKDKRVLMVTGMLADKETSKILDSFVRIADDFIATLPDSPRAWDCRVLAEEIRKRGKNCHVAEQIKEACSYAVKQAGEYDVVLFAGSLYMIGTVRHILKSIDL